MKIKKMCEVSICDGCGKDASYTIKCISCGAEYCFDCEKKNGKLYEHGVNSCGSGDGFFCNKCLANPPEKIRPLLIAYIKIQALREEGRIRREDYEKRCKVAEEELRKLRQEVDMIEINQ